MSCHRILATHRLRELADQDTFRKGRLPPNGAEVQDTPVEIPEPRYARAPDGAYIAYQVVGDGPIDVGWQQDFPRQHRPRMGHDLGVQLIDGKVGGISVVTASRISSLAGPSEVLISQTVKDLVAGSGFTFEDAGKHELKGVPDRWHLYRVVSERF